MATGTRRKLQDSAQSQSNQETQLNPGSHVSGAEQSILSDAESTSSGTYRSNRWQNRNYNRFPSQGMTPEKLAKRLAWFSIGLGLTEVLIPRKLAKFIGVRRANSTLIRLFGFREIASGIAIFAQGARGYRPAKAVWSRVAGDALDLTTMGMAFGSPSTRKGKLAFATANVLAVSALDVKCAKDLTYGANGGYRNAGSTQVKSLIINRSPEELYQAWRNFENLPRFLNNLESVQTTGGDTSHWVAKGPAGARVEWDARITNDRPNEHIAWRSLPGSDVDHSGAVYFERAPGDRGTIVKVHLQYNLPGGRFGSSLAKLFGHDPAQRALEALRHFKQVMETGEIIVSEGTLYDNGLLTQRPAQPEGDRTQTQERSRARSRRRTGDRQPTSTQGMEGNYAS